MAFEGPPTNVTVLVAIAVVPELIVMVPVPVVPSEKIPTVHEEELPDAAAVESERPPAVAEV